MARSRRGQQRSKSDAPADHAAADGTGGFVGQVALFETGNGLPFGPVEIALAIVAAVLIYPITQVVGMLRRR
jgi:hypothetical protein